MDNRKTKLENKTQKHKKSLEKGDFVQMYGYDVMVRLQWTNTHECTLHRAQNCSFKQYLKAQLKCLSSPI